MATNIFFVAGETKAKIETRVEGVQNTWDALKLACQTEEVSNIISILKEDR
jgi:hypothetical protein